MKKTIAALAIATAGMLALPAAFAQTAPTHHDGWFVNGQVGQTHINNSLYDGHDTGYQLTGGYRWALGQNVLLGVEGGYNDLGNIDVDHAFTSKDVFNRSQSELHGWMLGANGHFNINPNWYVSARAGLYQWKGHGLSNNSNPLRRSLDKTDWYSGVGFGYDFANNVSVGLNYDYYHAKKDRLDLSTGMVSVGAEYRF
ncbi:MAG TPA: porin family protein [Rhodanobacteraceae bacterium]